MSTTVYAVSHGTYSDYRIVQIFGDEDSAKKFADAMNAGDSYADADVEEYTLRGPDFRMPRWAGQTTVVDHAGEIMKTEGRTHTDEDGSYEGKVLTRVTGGRMALEPYEVYTHGEAARVPQAHSDAVAKLRAELMGL